MRVALNDTVQLAATTPDGYGDKTVTIISDIDACFLQGSGNVHSNNADVANADAHVYLDIDNPALVERGFKIEDMYIVAHPFEETDDESWYKISRVKVGQTKLLTNEVNNVHAFLKRVPKQRPSDGL